MHSFLRFIASKILPFSQRRWVVYRTLYYFRERSSYNSSFLKGLRKATFSFVEKAIGAALLADKRNQNHTYVPHSTRFFYYPQAQHCPL